MVGPAVSDAVPLIRLENISKCFGSLWANDRISFQVEEGEVHAVVGENGAGKSTLMKILHGQLGADSGTIYLRGKPVELHNPGEAHQAGIGMVHQQLLIFPQLTTLQNVMLGSEPSRWGFISLDAAREKLRQLCSSFGFQLPLDEMAGELSFARRQQIELLRVLYRGAKVLIMDEPTSLLAPLEVSKLLALLRSLKADGHTILFISHRLEEVFAIADRITILRRGRRVRTDLAARTTPEDVMRTIVSGGPDTPPVSIKDEEAKSVSPWTSPATMATPLLELRNLTRGLSGNEVGLDNLSLQVFQGEVLGLGAVVGNGERTLARLMSGSLPVQQGHIFFRGREITSLSIRERAEIGFRWLPANPPEEAMLPTKSIWENCLLGRQRKRSFQSKGRLLMGRIMPWVDELLRNNAVIYPHVEEPLSSLSGGNQQRIALGRVLEGSPSLVLLEQASRGLDIRARDRLYQRIRTLSDNGAAFLLLSYDMDELLSLSHRIGILYRGKLMGVMEKDKASRETLGKWMLGLSDRAECDLHGTACRERSTECPS
jgi:general nucleoside transport system ATP-binding protein